MSRSRFERFGLVRVLLAGAFVWVLIATHLILGAVVLLATGVAVLFGWRWVGETLRHHLQPSDLDHGMDHKPTGL